MTTTSKVLCAAGLLLALLLIGCAQPGSETSLDVSQAVLISVGLKYEDLAIDADGTNFYRFSAAGSAVHTIELTDLTSDMSWVLFNSTNLLDPNVIADCDTSDDTGDEVGVTPPLVQGQTYFLAIDEWDGSAGSFSLRVRCP